MSGVKGRSGRKPKSYYRARVDELLASSALECAKFIISVSNGEVKNPNKEQLDSARYVVNQAVGTPTQRHGFEADAEVIFRVIYDQEETKD